MYYSGLYISILTNRAGTFRPANLSALGRSGPNFSWAGPFRPKISAGRAVFSQYSAKSSPILRHFLK